MRNILIAILFLCTSFAWCNAGPVKPNKEFQKNWKTCNVKGRVKSIIEFNYKQYIPDSALSNFVTKEYFKFNKDGNVEEQTTFLLKEEFQRRTVYEYDNAGNYTHLTAYEEDSSLAYKCTYAFDEEGRMIEFINYNRFGGVKYKDERTYDASGSYTSRGLGSGSDAYKYTYDSKGRPTSMETYYNNEKICTRKTEWKYSGDTVEATSYHHGSFERKTLNIYNKNQQIIQHRSTSNDKIYECTNAYDANGNETECIWKISGELNKKDSYRREYVYDKNNNWIKRTTYNVDGSLKSSIERKIEYY
jgi:hypothetical protein